MQSPSSSSNSARSAVIDADEDELEEEDADELEDEGDAVEEMTVALGFVFDHTVVGAVFFGAGVALASAAGTDGTGTAATFGVADGFSIVTDFLRLSAGSSGAFCDSLVRGIVPFGLLTCSSGRGGSCSSLDLSFFGLVNT